ncbi:unnamed protein product [Alternaria alternata]
MAEVVGAVAAVVQFVDVALRLSSCLERFCSDVRNVPRRFLQLQIDLRQQIEIAQHIQNDHVPDFATTVSSSTLDAPLLEYISLADELSKTLERLLTRKNDGMLQRGWSGICSLSKKEEVANICDRLDQKRSILSIWLNAANLKLSPETAATIDKVRLEIGETLTLVKTVDKTSSATERSTARLLPHVEQIDQSVSATSEKAERIIQDLQYLKSQSMSLLTDRDVNITAQESSRQTTATILSYTEQILQAIEKLNSDSDRASLGTRDGFVSLEITMQLVPLSWLLSHTINVGTRVRNWSTVNPFSICPVVVGTSRLVDSKTSPAFRAIVNTIKELSQGEQHHVSIPRLQNTLQDLFDEKEASVLDINNDGTTILMFLRLTHKAKLSALNHASSIDGLAPIHFAVLWPTGLKMLLDRGVLVNPEDIYGRRPIHLAVVLGITDSVRYLLAEDCGLFTPPSGDSLLQFALRLKEPEKSQILRLLVPALIDRYKRLQNMASRFLPPSIFSKFELAPGQSREQKAPSMIETLIAHGIDVPQALELDGKGFYNFADHFSSIKMAPETASAFWDAGFREIDTPDNNGLTPFLQSWFSADFEMVDWFAQRGILMRSEHKSTPLTALHFYSARLRFPGDGFARDVNAVPTSEHYMDMIRKEMGIPYDDCRCACSPGGCAPIKFLFDPDIEDSMRKPRIRKWLENVRPSQALELEYVYHLTRYLLFDFLDGEHTCCYLGPECSIHYNVSRRERFMIKFGGQTGGSHERYDEHLRLCASGLPIPQRECLQALRDPDIFGKTLNSAMSHYDEMDRPDTMPLEEQAFKYINWLLIEGHLDIDVSYECEHWRRW